MAFINMITEYVAGKVNVEKHEKLAFERYHRIKGTEESLRALVDVAPESPPQQTQARYSNIPGDTFSASLYKQHSSFIARGPTTTRPLLQRSKSEIPTASNGSYSIRSTTGPTDISAVELSNEDIKRNYSTDNLWDPQVQKLPPLLPCTGIGKYRMSVAADPDWQVDNVKRKLDQLTPDFVSQMAETKLGGTHDIVWHRLATEHGNRSNSFASGTSSNSSSSQTLLLHSRISSTGTLVTRGFALSMPSSAASSVKGLQLQSRRSSEHSISSPGGDTTNRILRHHSNRNICPSLISSLSTIKEMHNTCDGHIRKIEKPCDFTDKGDPESALASDEDDEDEDEAWSDTIESQPYTRRPSGLSLMIEDHKRKSSIAKSLNSKKALHRTKSGPDEQSQDKNRNCTTLDRNRTIRATQPKFRRRHSRGSSNVTTKKSIHKPQAQIAAPDRTGAKHAITRTPSVIVVQSQQSQSPDDASEGIWMTNLHHTTNGMSKGGDLGNDEVYSGRVATTQSSEAHC